MAFDFGPSGRARLEQVAKRGPPDQRELAESALKADRRWSVAFDSQAMRDGRAAERNIRFATPDIKMTDSLRKEIGERSSCEQEKAACVLMRIGPDRYLLLDTAGDKKVVSSELIDLNKSDADKVIGRGGPDVEGVDLRSATLEVRKVERRQLHVDGKPSGEPFE